ncbi:hypothetical protein CPB84DRAFT_372967 [Gymnopilus junonius]|uniref:Uncharacterized protein n=1 Tax=Gymnopilus junonius TaxID=109634 RepID=A0A9P5THN2_GYMJU|nr:hypothetical protein CPB84DRAFT_372967 [Gymnopilus junonius]
MMKITSIFITGSDAHHSHLRCSSIHDIEPEHCQHQHSNRPFSGLDLARERRYPERCCQYLNASVPPPVQVDVGIHIRRECQCQCPKHRLHCAFIRQCDFNRGCHGLFRRTCTCFHHKDAISTSTPAALPSSAANANSTISSMAPSATATATNGDNNSVQIIQRSVTSDLPTPQPSSSGTAAPAPTNQCLAFGAFVSGRRTYMYLMPHIAAMVLYVYPLKVVFTGTAYK